MKHMDSTRGVAPPTSPLILDGIVVEPSASDLFASELRLPVRRVAASARELAAVHGIQVDELVLAGFQSPDDDGRELVLTCWIRADDAAANSYWDDLAGVASQVNAEVATEADDIRLAVSVRWDG